MWTFPARFLVEFFDNHGMLGFAERPQWRTVVGGSRSYVDAVDAAVARPPAARDAGRARSTRDEDGVDGHAARRRARALRRGRARHALRPGAARCSPTRPTASTRSSARSRTSPTRPCCTPTARLLPRRRRAWASWNYHLLAEPTGMTTVTYHMNRLQALDADREFCVTLNRTEAIDPAQGPAHDPLRAPGLHRRRRPRAGAPRRDQRRATARTSAAPTGAGASTRTASSSARARRPSASGRACAMYAGTIRHRRFAVREHAFSYRIALAYVDLDAPAAAATTSAAARVEELLGARLGRDPAADDAALARRRLQPVSLLLLLRRAATSCAGSSPRSRTRPGASATPTCSARRRRDARTRRSTSRRSWAWTTLRRSARPRPARRCRCTSRAAATASSPSTRRSTCARRPYAPARLLGAVAAHAAPSSTPTRVALEAQGRPAPSASPHGGLLMIARRRPRPRLALLQRIESGQLTLVEDGARHVFGSGSPQAHRRRARPAPCDARCCAAARAWPRPTSTACGTRPT